MDKDVLLEKLISYVIEQEQINQLEPGMTKRQVKFLLGTAVLTDFFHLNRWDYVYTVGEGSTPDEIRRVTVFFEDDRLVRIAGDMRPQPPEERVEPKKEIVVEVPDWEPGGKSLWQKGLSAIGLDSDSD
jgi:outer membrane protein assembly factor BamE